MYGVRIRFVRLCVGVREMALNETDMTRLTVELALALYAAMTDTQRLTELTVKDKIPDEVIIETWRIYDVIEDTEPLTDLEKDQLDRITKMFQINVFSSSIGAEVEAIFAGKPIALGNLSALRTSFRITRLNELAISTPTLHEMDQART